MMPVTVQHPEGLVTGANFRSVNVGVVGSDVRKADDGVHVAGSLWIMDGETQRRVQSRELTELSVGYTAGLDETPGTTPDGERYDAKQVEIRGNHIALLKAGQARGGPSVRLILDSHGDAVFDEEKKLMKFKIHADGLQFDVESVDDNVLRALEKERKDAEQILQVAESQAAEQKARADKAEADLLEAQKELKDFQAAAEKRARDAVVADALRLDKDLDIRDEDTIPDIQRRALKLDDKEESDELVGFRFKLALEDLAKDPPERDQARRLLYDTGDSSTDVKAFSIDDTYRELRG
jgi:hypothetical protein